MEGLLEAGSKSYSVRGCSVVVTCVCSIMLAATVSAEVLSRQEVEAQWESLLRREEYKSISYEIRPPSPHIYDTAEDYLKEDYLKNFRNRIEVSEGRGGYLWGIFGLSYGGGWELKGQLEDQVATSEGLLQLFSKAATKWSPGFEPLFIEPHYDRQKFPEWQMILILRDTVQREVVRMLNSTPFPPQEVLQHPQYKFHPDDPPCPLGQRCPRGQLSYDPARKVATIRILGLRSPVTVDVPLSEAGTGKVSQDGEP